MNNSSINHHLLLLMHELKPKDELDLLHFAREHGIQAHIGSNQITKAERFGGIAHRMKMVSNLRTILEHLRQQKIPALCLKGPTLSRLIYGESYQREYGDLDIIIPPAFASRTWTSLVDIGFEPGLPRFSKPGQNAALLRFGKAQNFTRNGLSLDLHWRLLSQWIACETPFEELWRNRQEVELAPSFKCQTLSNEHQLLFLALHGSQDGWPKLKQLLDLSLALNRLDYDPTVLYRIAGPRLPLLRRSISLATELLGAQSPVPFAPFFEGRDSALKFLASSMSKADPPQLALLAPSLWEAPPLEILSRSIRAILTPALDDIEVLEFPAWASAGYIPIRLVRLIGKLLSRRQLK